MNEFKKFEVRFYSFRVQETRKRTTIFAERGIADLIWNTVLKTL